MLHYTTTPQRNLTDSNASRHSSAASLKQMNASQLNVELDYAELSTPTPISPGNVQQRPKLLIIGNRITGTCKESTQ